MLGGWVGGWTPVISLYETDDGRHVYLAKFVSVTLSSFKTSTSFTSLRFATALCIWPGQPGCVGYRRGNREVQWLMPSHTLTMKKLMCPHTSLLTFHPVQHTLRLSWGGLIQSEKSTCRKLLFKWCPFHRGHWSHHAHGWVANVGESWEMGSLAYFVFSGVSQSLSTMLTTSHLQGAKLASQWFSNKSHILKTAV